jgi:hypothetical protein
MVSKAAGSLEEFHLKPKAKMFPLLDALKRVIFGFPKRVSNVPNNKLSAARPTTKLITMKAATPIAMRLVDTICSSKKALNFSQ